VLNLAEKKGKMLFDNNTVMQFVAVVSIFIAAMYLLNMR
jgi:hypothetical protein